MNEKLRENDYTEDLDDTDPALLLHLFINVFCIK